MRRLHFHRKLLLAFAAVLLPVLALLCLDFFVERQRTQEAILDAQSMTARAVAVQVAEAFDAAIELGRAVANDPIVQAMNPRELDSHLKRIAKQSPLYDAIGVYDATGLNRGWGHPSFPSEPRLRIGDRPYFKRVMATNAPVISEVIELRRPVRTGMLASVPIRDASGRPVGVVNVVMETELLVQRYMAARLQSGQDIFLADPSGRLAFHTAEPHLAFNQSDAFAHFAPVLAALAGTPIHVDRFESPLTGDLRMGAFVPAPKYGWVVGVTTPRQVALSPLYRWTRMKLGGFGLIALMSMALAAVLARFYARPVRQLQSVVRRLGRGEMDVRVQIETGDELEELGGAFNDMVAQITQRQAEVSALLQRERALARIGQALVSEVEIERMAQVVIAHSRGALGADAVGLWLARPERRELELVVAHGIPPAVLEHMRRLTFDAPLFTARAARLGAIQAIEDVIEGEVPPIARAFALESGFRSVVAVPLHARERLGGVMTCFTERPRRFSAHELEFHSMVGQLFAVAFEKARLFQQVREALRLREEFMTAAAHELRTPVTTIQIWAEILLKWEASSPRQHKGLGSIVENTRRLGRLVEHLLAAEWMAPGMEKLARERCDLRALVAEAVQSAGRTLQNPIRVRAGGPLIVDADRQRMREVVGHLLENAVRYSPPGEAIEVELREEGGEAVVAVHHHGPSIPPERQPHVFEPLYEPLPSGAPGYAGVVGLGLYLSQQIVGAHGGRIWVESAPGEGTTFCFSLALAETNALQQAGA